MMATLPLFGRRPTAQTDAEKQMAAVDLERIAQGGIPQGAEQRLTALATKDAPVFSSDLSAKEYALAQASGLQPLAQVMGSSVVQHGWQNYGWNAYGGGIREMPQFAEAWNLSRERSFGRLQQEAAFAGADAVIGIELVVKPFIDDPSQVELAVYGTAVRETTLTRAERSERDGDRPRLCALSGQDVDKLRRIGAETIDVVGHSAVVCVSLDAWANQRMGMWSGNQEVPEISQGVYEARRLAMNQVRRQGSAVGANDMVISTLNHQIHHHEYERNNYTHHFFIVAMHVLATAIRLGAHEPHPAPLKVPMMSVNLGDQ